MHHLKKAFVYLMLIFVVAFKQGDEKIRLFMIGDSTMADKPLDENPERGWGRLLPLYLVPGMEVQNHAMNGRSTKSFLKEGRWDTVLSRLKKGDYVFIEFGHNDEKVDKPAVYAAANTDYRTNLIKFINEVRAKKAFPVLLTPVMRRKFDANGIFQDTHGEYPDAVRKVAQELKVPLIDLHRKTETLLKNYGDEASKSLFLQIKEGENPNYPKGVTDNTHFNPKGAEEVARLAVEEIRDKKLKLKKYLKK